MQIPIVDENDNIIKYKNRDDRNPMDIIRITAIWIQDEKGDILLQQRKLTKKNSPGKWGPGASGTVEEGETYEGNAYKEIEEEIGVKNVNLIGSKKFFGESMTGGKRFAQLYLCTLHRDQELLPEEDEVEQLKWFTKEELLSFYRERPSEFVGLMKDILEFLYR